MRCTKEEEEYESSFGARFELIELAGGKGVVEVGTVINGIGEAQGGPRHRQFLAGAPQTKKVEVARCDRFTSKTRAMG